MAEDDGKRAYNALLTLLDDGSTNPGKRQKREPSVSEPRPSTESTVEAVEGLESENEDEDDDEDEIQIDDDNEGDTKDPFECHFASPAQFSVPEKWVSEQIHSLPLIGERSVVQLPEKGSRLAHDEEVYKAMSTKAALSKVKHRLHAPFFRTNGEKLTPLQAQLAGPLFRYQDILVTGRTWENYSEYLDLTVLHMLNHIYKTRGRILKNNTKLREAQQQKADGDEDEAELDTDKFRDQGFTRPKVLVLLPTRQAAYEFVDRINKISGLNQAENRRRFKDSFYLPDSNLKNKPSDFQHTFAGNTNEVFCLGVKFTRQALKLYSSFYACDLIIASPLGLRLIVDKKDFDFLSSIELCICDQLDSVAMQSWINIKHIFEKLNTIPKNPHDCDFSRLREWYLDDKAKYLRQTILLTSYPTPEMVALFNKNCKNVAGKFRTRFEYPGIIPSLRIHVKQVFQRIGSSSFSQDSQQRLQHFANTLLPSLLRGAQTDGILLVAPSYTDFVVLRNYLEKHDHSYVSLSEYTSPSQLGRGRTFFADGRAKMMLYSARLHHYRRYGIKGTRTVVFYGLPDNPIFYQEFVRSLARTVIESQVDPDLLKVHVLFSKWDALKLERIVGTQRMAPLMEGISDTHEFY